ncbi:hypothetical protein [Streptomyces sp. V4I8]|uniref:hypothetical protein n=1 Tax=Streptomyces sp. V4I8 TaxID=3156469 RepID=UPI00351792AE
MATEVRHVVRNVIAEHAPEELVLLDAAEQVPPAARNKRLAPGNSTREALGFGLEVATALVVPILWLVLTELARQTAQTVAESTTEGVRGWWRGRRNRRGGTEEPTIVPPLSREQISLVRGKVLDQCAEAGIEPGRATAIANAVFHELAVYAPDASGGADALDAPEAPDASDTSGSAADDGAGEGTDAGSAGPSGPARTDG